MGQAFYLQFACKIWHNKVITPPPPPSKPCSKPSNTPLQAGWWRGGGWMVEGVRLDGGGGEVSWWRGWGWMVEGVRLVGGGGEVGWWRGWGWMVEGVRLVGGGGEVGWWRGWGWMVEGVRLEWTCGWKCWNGLFPLMLWSSSQRGTWRDRHMHGDSSTHPLPPTVSQGVVVVEVSGLGVKLSCYFLGEYICSQARNI